VPFKKRLSFRFGDIFDTPEEALEFIETIK
jgi:hypothetical protein